MSYKLEMYDASESFSANASCIKCAVRQPVGFWGAGCAKSNRADAAGSD